MKSRSRFIAAFTVLCGAILAGLFFLTSAQQVETTRAEYATVSSGAHSVNVPAELPLDRNPYLVDFLNGHLQIDKRLPDDIDTSIVSIDTPEDIQAVSNVLADKTEPETIRNYAANLLRKAEAASLWQNLNRILQDQSEEERMRAFALQHIDSMMDATDQQPAQLMKLLEGLLSSASPVLRSQAFQTLLKHRNPSAEDLRRALLVGERHDEQLIVASLYSIADRQETELISTVRTWISSEAVPIRIAAISTLGVLRDQQSKPLLFALRDAENPLIRNAVKVAIVNLDAPPARASQSIPRHKPAANGKQSDF